MDQAHTDRTYEAELRLLRERMLAMAATVEQMIADAARALVARDAALARATIQLDHQVNRAELRIDELCMLILAKRQPVASDLRFVTLSLKMVTDLERIGDVAVNVCERVQALVELPPIDRPTDEFEVMATLVREMVRDAIEAFITRDVERALGVLRRDDAVDGLYRQYVRENMSDIRAHPEALEQDIHLQAVAKFLERIGDHATNLAEQVVFLVRGEDLRHQGKLG